MDVSVTIQENIMYAKKGYVWNLSTCACENNRFLKCFAYIISLIADLIITSERS